MVWTERPTYDIADNVALGKMQPRKSLSLQSNQMNIQWVDLMIHVLQDIVVVLRML